MHIPVLSKEVSYYLDVQPNRNYIDCTLGGGGHTLAILERSAPNGKVLAIDWSREAIERFKFQITNSKFQKRVILVHDNFKNLKKIIEHYQFESIYGILLDLGLSSYLLEESGRGFSFLRDEPLDMRFNAPKDSDKSAPTGQVDIPNNPSDAYLTAAKIVNQWPEQELFRIFRKYGEDPYARKIAKAICEDREREKIQTTKQLVDLIVKAIPGKKRFRVPSYKFQVLARVFQALRIVVNDELENLKQVFGQTENILLSKGRIVVISYHSLEDRIVKRFFLKAPFRALTKKPVRPGPEELKDNPRARSAKLRAYQKIENSK